MVYSCNGFEMSRSTTPREIRECLDRAFAGSPSLRALAEAYCREPIVLYTGAGVSSGFKTAARRDREFGLPVWLPLLREVVREAGGPDSAVTSADPWQAAEEAVTACGGRERFESSLVAVIGRPHNYERHNGQLAGPLVRGATTLRATAAFCGRLTAQIADAPKSDARSPRTYFTAARNDRVAAVLTSNYDCFLEAASSNLFRKPVLKPVTALGSLAASLTRSPVFHVHGFVPHPLWQKERIQMVPGLVIRTEDYERAWNEGDVFGTTMAPQIHYLRHYTVLFVGFSFADQYVRKLLCRLKEEFKGNPFRSHFALVPEDGPSDVELRALGVLAIRWHAPEDIASMLGRVYVAGLRAEGAEALVLPEVHSRTHELTGRTVAYPLDRVWDLINACRNEGVGTSLARRCRDAARSPDATATTAAGSAAQPSQTEA